MPLLLEEFGVSDVFVVTGVPVVGAVEAVLLPGAGDLVDEAIVVSLLPCIERLTGDDTVVVETSPTVGVVDGLELVAVTLSLLAVEEEFSDGTTGDPLIRVEAVPDIGPFEVVGLRAVVVAFLADGAARAAPGAEEFDTTGVVAFPDS